LHALFVGGLEVQADAWLTLQTSRPALHCLAVKQQQQQFLLAIQRNKQYIMKCVYDMMADCQVGRGPSMLAAYNVSLL